MSTPALRAKWQAAGVCTNCGCRPHALLGMQCEVCLERKRVASRRHNGRKAIQRLKMTRDLLTFARTGTTPPAKGCL